MISKSFHRTGTRCLVTFTVPPEVEADAVHVCGDFNGWSNSEHALTRRKDGRFSRSLSLRCGRSYEFRYLIDETRWENEGAADGYEPNPFGSENSVLTI